MMTNRFLWSNLLFWLFFAGLLWLSQDHVFFWDTVQFAGKHGLWFYEQQFRQFLLPPEIDSGHPPGFAWYLALVWLTFGKSLAISHWAMFPFLMGICWQLFRLGQLLLHRISPYWLVLIAVADPVFLGQSVLVSPDVVLIFFFLWALNSLLQQRPCARTFAYLGLAFISMRGMMLVAAFACFECWLHWPELKHSRRLQNFRWVAAYLPAGIFSLAFFIFHYRQFGWIAYHSASPWAPSFTGVDAAGLLRNLLVWVWRWLDYGRVFVWLAIFVLYFQPAVLRLRPPLFAIGDKRLKPAGTYILCFLLIVTALLCISFLSYRGLQAHRYLWPAFLLFHLFCLILADQVSSPGFTKKLLLVLFIGLLSGNLWVYPKRIAQGWDATLAHWPYYALRQQMLDYLQAEAIPLTEVGTAFPDIGPLKFRDLSDNIAGFKERDLIADQWIVYSNIMNDFSDEELLELETHWIEQKRFSSGRIEMILYRKTF